VGNGCFLNIFFCSAVLRFCSASENLFKHFYSDMQ
jgi:hypothetical protein